MPLRTTSQPILPQRKGGVSLADLLQQLRRREPLTAEALEILASGHNAVVNTLRQPPPSLEDVTVTDPTGALITRIGSWVDGEQVRSGFWTREFYQGGLDPASAVLYSDENGQLVIGRNGSASVLDPYGDSAAWIGTQWDTLAVTGALDNGAGLIRLLVPLHTFVTGDEVLVDQVGGVSNATGVWTVTVIDPNTIDLQKSGFGGAYTSGGWITRVLHVTGAVDNGSGLVRLTVASHGYESGDRVHVESVGGVPNATGQWTVTVVDADHIDLEGSVFAGAHSGGGVCIRFFAGGLFQNIAIGPSFSDYRLRAFPDGTLRIRNAEIGLVSADGRISMDPDGPEIALEEFPDGDEIVHLGRWYKGDGDPEDPANYWVGLYAKRAWFGGAGPGDASVLIDGPSITIKTLEAPNVLEGTTTEAYYCDVNGTETPTGRYYGFKGTITLPRTDPNYAHLRLVRAMVTHPAPSTLREDVRTVYRPDFTADVIDWRSPWWPRPTVDETFQKMEFEVENGEGKITPDPFTVSEIAVIGQAASPEDLPLLPLSVACSENPAERYSDAVNLTHMFLRPTAVLPPDHGALWISWWFSRDAGVTWEWLGKYWTTETPVVDVLHPNDASPQNWLVRGATGNHAGDNSPDVAVVSAPFEIAGLAAVPASGATSITGATASYVVDFVKCPWAFYPTITWTAPPHQSFFHTRLRVKLYNQAGELSPDPKYAGLGQEAGQWTNQGTQTYTEPYGWMLPPINEPANGFRYFRLYLYAVTRAGQETLCNAWAGGASYGTLTVTENRKVDPPELGPGLTKTDDGKVKLATDNLANMVLNPGFEDGPYWGTPTHWVSNGPFITEAGAMTGTRSLGYQCGAYRNAYQVFSVRPGDQYVMEVHAAKSAGADGAFGAWVHGFNGAGVQVQDTYIGAVSAPVDAWGKTTLTFTVAAGVSTIRLFPGVLIGSAAGTSEYYLLDNVYLQKVKTASEILIGKGLLPVDGAVALDENGDILTDANGHPVLKLGSVKSNNLAPGSLGADLTKYSADKKPVGVYYGLPLYSDANAPDVIFNTADGKLYRRAGGTWSKAQDPADIVTGFLAAGVTVTGTVYAHKVIEQGGGITGCRLTLNLNGVTASIDNQYDATYGAYAGLRVQLNSSNWRAIISYNGLAVVDQNGYRASEFSARYFALNNAVGNATIDAFGATGALRATTFRLNAGSAPASPIAGTMYYDQGTNTMRYWNGASWVVM